MMDDVNGTKAAIDAADVIVVNGQYHDRGNPGMGGGVTSNLV